MTIRTRLILAFFLLATVGFYELVMWNIENVRPSFFSGMEETMVDVATLLAAQVENGMQGDALSTKELGRAFDTAKKRRFSAQIYELTKTQMDMRVYITDAQGIVIFDSDNGREEGQDFSQWNNIARTMRGEYGARASRATPDEPMSATFHVSSPILSGGHITGVLTVCKPAQSVSTFVQTARWEITLAGIFAAISVILMGMVVTFWITRPIARLTQYAKEIRDGRRAVPPSLGSSEIGMLGAAFEEMRTALEGKQYVEEYVQTLTHQMKSPLSAIRGAAELLEEEMPSSERRKFLENLRAESRRIQDIIDRMLELSSVENRRELRDIESVDLADLVVEILGELNPILGARHIESPAPSAPAVTVQGERFLIRQAITSLIQNAIDFTPDEGVITVQVENHPEGAAVTVLDNGPGIPEYALEKVFDRFYSLRRPATGRKSSGLGLPLVREVALLHGGQAYLENRPEGGARAILILPSEQSSIE